MTLARTENEKLGIMLSLILSKPKLFSTEKKIRPALE
jgi:hypothetical protein